MAEVVGIGGNYLHRSIDQLQRSMNERGALLHDYKQFADLRNTIVADYTIKANLNNNNNHSSDNRNQSNNQSPELIEQKHSHQIHQQLLQQQQQQHQQQQHFNSSSSPPIVNFSISNQQMNGTKVSLIQDNCLNSLSFSFRFDVSIFK